MLPVGTIRSLILAAPILASVLPLGTVDAADPYVPPLTAWINNALVDFPNAVEFHMMFVGVPDPQRVDLEFSIHPVHSCDGGTVHSVRFPGKTTIVWRWEPAPGQPLPPGRILRWRWRVTGGDGTVRVSHEREVLLEDERFDWQSYAQDPLAIHWYGREPEFGEHLAGFLEPQLDRIRAIETGRRPVNVFVYQNALDSGPGALLRRDNVNPYRAFNTVVSVIPEESQGDELTALIHELAHIAIQDRGFNCFNGLPHWLEEGLATLAEGEMSQEMRVALAEARLIEQLVPLRSFDAPFHSDTRGALTRYAQSYDLVEFLKDEFGWDGIGRLIDLFKDGVTVDGALKTAFGIDTDEAERLWRLRRNLPDPAPNRPNRADL